MTRLTSIHTIRQALGFFAQRLATSVVVLTLAGCTVGAAAPTDEPSLGFPTPNASIPADPPLPPLSTESFWLAMVSGDPGAVVYDSSAAMLDDAELVVVGTIGDISQGRALSGGPGSLTAFMANVTVRVTRVIKGAVVSTSADALTLETVVGVATEFPVPLMDRLVASRSDEEAVFFLMSRDEWLRRMAALVGTAGGGRDIYMLIGGQGFIRNMAERSVLSPYAHWSGADPGRSFDDLVADLAAESSGTQ